MKKPQYGVHQVHKHPIFFISTHPLPNITVRRRYCFSLGGKLVTTGACDVVGVNIHLCCKFQQLAFNKNILGNVL